MEDSYKNLLNQYPFISYLTYGGNEYIGVIQNSDELITTIYDYALLKSLDQKTKFLELAEQWWWESNRQFPINIFCRDQIQPYSYAVKTFNSKDVRIILGPVVNLMNLTLKRVKRKSVQLIRKTR